MGFVYTGRRVLLARAPVESAVANESARQVHLNARFRTGHAKTRTCCSLLSKLFAKTSSKKIPWLLLRALGLVRVFPHINHAAILPVLLPTAKTRSSPFFYLPPANHIPGNSKPRIVQQIEAVVAPKKRTTTTTKANTSKPRTSKVATGRVAKPKAATTTTTKRTTKATGANVKTVKKPRTTTEKVVDKVVGKAEKIVGDVEGKPGKKVC